MSDSLVEVSPVSHPATIASPSRWTLFAVEVCGLHVDIALLTIRSSSLLIVTQLKKVGTIIQVTLNNGPPAAGSTPTPVYSTRVLLGEDRTEVHAAARFLASTLDVKSSAIITLGLRDFTVDFIRSLAEQIRRHISASSC